MDIELSSRSEELIRQKVASGQYRDASEVLEEALLILEEHDQQRLVSLRAALDIAEEELARGEGIPYTPDLVAEMRQSARKMAREGRAPDTDVCP